MFKFRLCNTSGEDLGDYVAAVPNWRPGDTLYEAGAAKYRVRSVIAADDGHVPVCAILEVEPV